MDTDLRSDSLTLCASPFSAALFLHKCMIRFYPCKSAANRLIFFNYRLMLRIVHEKHERHEKTENSIFLG